MPFYPLFLVINMVEAIKLSKLEITVKQISSSIEPESSPFFSSVESVPVPSEPVFSPTETASKPVFLPAEPPASYAEATSTVELHYTSMLKKILYCSAFFVSSFIFVSIYLIPVVLYATKSTVDTSDSENNFCQLNSVSLLQ